MKSIGIKLADGTFYPIMKDGSVEKKTLDVTTVQDNQTKVQIDLYRSDTDSMDDAEYVDSLEISNLNPHPNGEPNLHLNLSLDETGHLQADVIDPETGRQSGTQVTLVTRSEEERAEPANFQLDTTTADALADIDAVDSMLKNSIESEDNFIEPIPSTIEDIENTVSENDFDNPDEASLDLPDFNADATTPLVEPEDNNIPDLFNTKLPELDLTDFEEESKNTDTDSPESDDFGLPNFSSEGSTEESTGEDDFSFDLDSIDLPATGFAEHDDATLAVDMAAIKPGKFTAITEDDTAENEVATETSTETEDTVTEESATIDNTLTIDENQNEDNTESVDDTPSIEEPITEENDFTEIKSDDLTVEEPVTTTDSTVEEPVTEESAITEVRDTEITAEEPLTERNKNIYADWDSSAVLAAGTVAEREEEDFALPDFDDLEPTGSINPSDFSLPDFDDSDLDASLGLTADANAGTDFSIPDFESDSPTDVSYTSFDSDDNPFETNTYTQGSSMFDGLYDKDRLSEQSYEEEDYDEKERRGTAAPVIVCVVCAVICILAALLVLFIIPSNINIFKKNQNTNVQIAKTEEPAVSKEDKSPSSTQTDTVASSKEDKGSNKAQNNAATTSSKEERADSVPAKESQALKAKEETQVLEAKEDKIVVATKPSAVIPESPAKPAVKIPDTKYRVKWGDTLWDISASYYKNPWRYTYIARYNGIRNPDYIQAGQIILIPAE